MGLYASTFLPEPLANCSQEVEGLLTLSQIREYYGEDFGLDFVNKKISPQSTLEERFLIESLCILKKYDCYRLTWLKDDKLVCAYLWNKLIIRIFK